MRGRTPAEYFVTVRDEELGRRSMRGPWFTPGVGLPLGFADAYAQMIVWAAVVAAACRAVTGMVRSRADRGKLRLWVKLQSGKYVGCRADMDTTGSQLKRSAGLGAEGYVLRLGSKAIGGGDRLEELGVCDGDFLQVCGRLRGGGRSGFSYYRAALEEWASRTGEEEREERNSEKPYVGESIEDVYGDWARLATPSADATPVVLQ